MESKFKQFVSENKGFIVFYLIWFLLHLIFLCIGKGDVDYGPWSSPSGFWPFVEHARIDDYGFMEFSFYLITPIIILFLWKLVGKDIKK